jgi:hypothetical protein
MSIYMQAQAVPLSQAVVRLDGQYGNGAIVADLAGLAYVMRGKDYDLLDLESVQARLAQSTDQQTAHPETRTRPAPSLTSLISLQLPCARPNLQQLKMSQWQNQAVPPPRPTLPISNQCGRFRG